MSYAKKISLGLLGAFVAVALLMPTAAVAKIHGDDDAATEESGKTRARISDELTSKTTTWGQKLFYQGEPAGSDRFKTRYSKESGLKVDGKSLPEAIAAAHEGQEEGEVAIAHFLGDMMIKLSEKEFSLDYKWLKDAFSKLEKKGDSDLQFEEFTKRAWVAFNNWGIDKKTKKEVDQEPADEKLKPFYQAWKEAKKKVEAEAEEKNKLIKDAANGNKAAQAKLLGDKDDKSNPEKNKYAVGKDIIKDINRMFANGETDRAKEMIKALSTKDTKGTWVMNVNSADGKPIKMELPPLTNDAALKNTFANQKLASADFVGHEHPADHKPITWVWDKNKKDIVKANPVAANAPTGKAVAGGAAGAGAAAGANAAANNGAQDGASASSGSADGAALFQSKCLSCHGPKDPAASAKAVAEGTMPPPAKNNLTQADKDALASHLNGLANSAVAH